MNKQETIKNRFKKNLIISLISMAKIVLFFMPFATYKGCGAGTYYPFAILYYIIFLPILLPFIFVFIGTIIPFFLLKYPKHSIKHKKTGLAVSLLSLFGVIYTGMLVLLDRQKLEFGFWGLLICDLGLVSRYIYELFQLKKFKSGGEIIQKDS